MTSKKQKGGRGRSQAQKFRVDLRKNKQTRARQQNLTQEFLNDDVIAEDAETGERVGSRTEQSRRRTIVGTESSGEQLLRAVDETDCLKGRVTSFIGLNCMVREEGTNREFECVIRGVLRSLARDSRNVVVTGDRVLFRQEGDDYQGVIERVQPRHGVLSRGSHGREHILVSNIDQVLIVVSAADPEFKPQLVDRFLLSAERHDIRPVVCINKTDLVDPRTLTPCVAAWGRCGYSVLLTSVVQQRGLDLLKNCLSGRQTAVSGQSGVGKSSLLNSVDRGLELDTADVSGWSHKGTHTTRRARLVPLSFGGWVADTPGIRQFELWDLPLSEVDGYFVEFRPFIAHCRFPDCTHIHENDCGVKSAVEQCLIARHRYDSYLRLREEDIFLWKNPARGTSASS
ncbi:MAG: ribosome small subunit-dependent GTPase A [Planctomycetaceae bacterium]|nr:ribosome small subunit-dependent GTPase A [Planctomycetaceae bacterium]